MNLLKIRLSLVSLALLLFKMSAAQTGTISGKLLDDTEEPVIYANVSLHLISDSTLVKVEPSNEEGVFTFHEINPGSYFLRASFVGFAELEVRDLILEGDQKLELQALTFESSSVQLETATITAQRSILEVRSDRTVFNVQGTINSAGENAIELLRKAPGVLVDNNDNISVLSRSGVLVYIDGKRLPLSGQDLSNYLQNLTAEQIDRIDIISNPGAKYEAEGNAGIIDIRLKKDKNTGANGTVSSNISQGFYNRGNVNVSGNYRNKNLNIFGNAGYNGGSGFNTIIFDSYQNNLILDEYNRFKRNWNTYDYRVGADFFINKNHTLGFIMGGQISERDNNSANRIEISPVTNREQIDSILVANNTSTGENDQNTFNINYRFEKDQKTLNIDADYGRFRNTNLRYQPNQYFDQTEKLVLTEVVNSFDTPRDIDIYTFKVDYEVPLGKGKFGVGTKLSKVTTDNTFLLFDVLGGEDLLNNQRSNRFKYDESVYAAYVTYTTPLGEKWNLTTGLRAEETDATGDLQAFLPELQEDPVDFDYLSWFPSAGLTYQLSQQNMLSLNYGRRINRPDYNVLNPFRNQLSELSFEKGNAFLQPEIVNNLELGYTLKYMYNFKLAYSRTVDQITRLIGPSEEDVRASFITWDNLASQTIFSANVSAPIQFSEIWNAYINLSGSHINNQADYGNGAIVDVQAWSYNMFQQHTIKLPKGFTGEVSGWYSGPGVWGGVFLYQHSWSLNLGLQKKFFKNNMNVKLSAQDIFYESGWEGVSEFNGLMSEGFGNWDSRRVSLSVSYNFGNQNIKSRNRKTGMEDESKRVGGE
ncbi:MAG: TonB-dependent receptor [Saprospiraceae bacterium]|nr:TonB-dependent receptor [Saprospiraceae bacterium]